MAKAMQGGSEDGPGAVNKDQQMNDLVEFYANKLVRAAKKLDEKAKKRDVVVRKFQAVIRKYKSRIKAHDKVAAVNADLVTRRAERAARPKVKKEKKKPVPKTKEKAPKKAKAEKAAAALAKAAARVPWVTYTEPELAQVGLTEAEARAEFGGRVRVLRADFAANDRARTDLKAKGLLKVMVVRGRPVGASIAGPQAGELIGTGGLVPLDEARA